MHAFFQTLLSTQITLGTALPLLVMAALLVLVAAKAASRPPTPLGTVAKAQPTVLARGDAWLEKIGIGPFWRTAFWVLALAFAFLFIMAIMAAFVLIAGMIKSDTPTTSLGLGALLVALLGAPFLIWRTVVAQNTLDTARKEAKLKEESLFNDKINAAAKDLAATYQVTEPVKEDGKQTFITTWKDDLVTRAAAIDRLEGLAIDAIAREEYPPAQRIARMLSHYVQELSKEHPPNSSLHFESEANVRNWRYSEFRKHCRQDMERAVQSLGRINPKDEAARDAFMPRNINLTSCNLQGFDLRNRQYQGTRFRHANLQAADLEGAHLERSDLTETDLRDVDLCKAHLQGAMLFQARMSTRTQIVDCNFSGAAVFFVDDETITKLRPHWNNIIAFLKWLPSDAPDHWHEVNNFNPDQAEAEWRSWAAEHHPAIKIYTDYRDKDPT
jgi:hypothetical protein